MAVEEKDEKDDNLAIQDNKIFIYLRLRDDKETLVKSKIREFAGLGKLQAEFIKQILENYGPQILKLGSLEYMDSNTDMVLVSFKKDVIRQKIIVSGLIPKEYQSRMLDQEEARIKFPLHEFLEKITPSLDPVSQAIVHQRMQKPPYNIFRIIKENINENGEFYIILDIKNT